MKQIKINDSKYSFEIQEDGQVKLYRCHEDVTKELGYNIVNDMAYMIADLQEQLPVTKK